MKESAHPLENTSTLDPSPMTGEPKSRLAELVAAHPFLKGFSASTLTTLTDAAMLKEFEADEMIFREGDIANRFYLIRDGRVAVEAPEQRRNPVLIQTVNSGEVLGWSWLFPPYYWHFSARAMEPTRAIFFYGTRLREQCEQDTALGYELMRRMTEVVVHRLQSTRKQLLALHRRG